MASPAEINRLNYLNALLMLASCGLAYAFPFSLLLFSYAILGPAHYLTQISWLHDRKYFSKERLAPGILTIMTVVLLILSGIVQDALWIFTLGLALALILPLSRMQQLLAILLSAFAGYVLSSGAPFFTYLLPTVIHVFVFTALFVLVGTLKENSISGAISLVVMLACGASFFLLPERFYENAQTLDHVGVYFFSGVASYLNDWTGLTVNYANTVRVFAFLSFAYTYHYLNWFSKTRVIQWHDIPRKRLIFIVLMYLVAIGTYFYDYAAGFKLLLFLSVLHVVLEFPLNWQSLIMIVTLLRKKI